MDITELVMFIYDHRQNPFTWTVLCTVLLFLFDKLARNLITNHVGRLGWNNNQLQRIENKVDALIQERGINTVWETANYSGSISYPKKLRNLLMCYLVDMFPVDRARPFINLRRINMPTVNRVWLFTIIVFIGGMISKRMGIEFSDEIYNEVTDFLIYIALPLAGFALDKFKTKEETPPTESNK